MTDNIMWMQRAFELAQRAEDHDEVPVGAVVVYEGDIIGEGWNQPISSNDPTAHAEIVALRQAGQRMNNYRLPGAVMYVTLEPCVMCAGALVHARLAKLVYAVDDPKTGACGGVFNVLESNELNHNVKMEKGMMQDECRALLQHFLKRSG